MGCGKSKLPVERAARRTLQLMAFQKQLDHLRVSHEEAGILYDVFDQADINRDGFMQLSEFLKLMNVSENSIWKRLFEVWDKNGNRELDFGEYVAALWLFLTHSEMSLASLAFQLYDRDGSGSISTDEVIQLVRELSQDPTFDRSALTQFEVQNELVVSGTSKESSKRVNEAMFLQFALKNPAVLYPALRIQEQMRDRICGKAFWLNITQRRAGAQEVVRVQDFVSRVKRQVAADGQLTVALGKLRDGKVAASELAPKSEADRVRMTHMRFFGLSSRAAAFIRQLSGSFRRKSPKVAADDKDTGKGKGKKEAPRLAAPPSWAEPVKVAGGRPVSGSGAGTGVGPGPRLGQYR